MTGTTLRPNTLSTFPKLLLKCFSANQLLKVTGRYIKSWWTTSGSWIKSWDFFIFMKGDEETGGRVSHLSWQQATWCLSLVAAAAQSRGGQTAWYAHVTLLDCRALRQKRRNTAKHLGHRSLNDHAVKSLLSWRHLKLTNPLESAIPLWILQSNACSEQNKGITVIK